jgi:hypothetical protein
MADQLAKIVPLLGSPVPGEVVAAAAAIGRVLASSGRDWHWLSGALSGSNPVRSNDRLLDMALDELRRTKAQLESARGELSIAQRLVRDMREDAVLAGRELSSLRRRIAELERAAPPQRATRPQSWAPIDAGPSVTREQWRFRVGRMITWSDLSERERVFLASVKDRLDGGTRPSEKQAGWLSSLWARYRQAESDRRGRGPPKRGWSEELDDDIPF